MNDLQPSLDEIFAAHEGGKLATGLETPLANARDLAIAYTPGVAQVSRAIAAEPALARRYTWADRLVAVVSDGTAVLGLGDIAPTCRAGVSPAILNKMATRNGRPTNRARLPNIHLFIGRAHHRAIIRQIERFLKFRHVR